MFENRLELFPASTSVENGILHVGQANLSELAQVYGTPLYVYDAGEMDLALHQYVSALQKYWPSGKWGITYAGKAYLSSAICQWVAQNSIDLDCTGAGEIGIAARNGLPAKNIKVHGVNKNREDLKAAFDHAGTIIVDNLAELENIARLAGGKQIPQLWLRFQPGSSVDTHSYTQTGHAGSKFGMDADQTRQAITYCKQYGLPLAGIHFHQGSQFRDPEPLGDALCKTLDLVSEAGFGTDWHLSPGGGWGVSYNEKELPNPSIEHYVRFICELAAQECKKRGIALPTLHLEPGRSLVARAGVALYEVNAVKTVAGKNWALIDGGLADNPRHALYNAQYSCLRVNRPFDGVGANTSLAGPFCESGDVLIEAIDMPLLAQGDLVAIPVSGAYQLSMASNYNGARKPAVLSVKDGTVRLVQRRETVEDLIDRDL